MGFLRLAAIVAWKDLRVELRTREILSTMIFFAAMIVILCSFAFVERVPSIGDMASGILWIAVAFSGTLGLQRSFEREREGSTMRALLLSPAPRGAIFLGKALGVAAYILIVEVVAVPLIGLLHAAPVQNYLPETIAFLLLVAVGFGVVGSVFAGMLLRTRAREVLLPIVLFPIITPLLIAGVKGTANLWNAAPVLKEAHFWIKFLVVFDVLFLMTSLWAFESLVVE
jgi:heme exporter protein B